jgi:hypothetical protein
MFDTSRAPEQATATMSLCASRQTQRRTSEYPKATKLRILRLWSAPAPLTPPWCVSTVASWSLALTEQIQSDLDGLLVTRARQMLQGFLGPPFSLPAGVFRPLLEHNPNGVRAYQD